MSARQKAIAQERKKSFELAEKSRFNFLQVDPDYDGDGDTRTARDYLRKEGVRL